MSISTEEKDRYLRETDSYTFAIHSFVHADSISHLPGKNRQGGCQISPRGV